MWDKTLEEQPKKVRENLAKMLAGDDPTLVELYQGQELVD